MINATQTNALHRWVGILCLVVIGCSSVGAQSLYTLLAKPTLDSEQEHYLAYVKNSPMNHSLQFIEVNMETLEGNSFVFAPSKDESYTVVKNQRGEQYAGLTSWCGTIDDGYEYGDINIVIDDGNLVGHIAIGTRIFAITPLGKGIHAFYQVDSSLLPPEECYDGRDQTEVDDESYLPAMTPRNDNPDHHLRHSGLPKATGECKIRVLIGFTDSVQQRFLSLSSEIVNLFNLANAAYDNAEVGFNIELAMAYEVDYVETDSLRRDLNRWRRTDDGYMDEVHTNRTLFDGDMCALLINDGGGRANGTLEYANTFSITGANNFSVFTFHHELGHNMGCSHDLINTDEPGTAPYAGYGEPTFGCFRTIMAYQEACGTGSSFDCDRVNVFSRLIDTYTCNASDFPKGGPNNRNRDRLVLSKDAINNHTTVFTNITYGGDYNWRSDESINFVAEETVGYNSSTANRWDMFSGSEGSFRASEEVTLGEGFWARTGATFSAYLESCDDISPGISTLVDLGYQASEPSLQSTDAEPSRSAVDSKYFHDLAVFPNPFQEGTTVQFLFHGGNQRVTITLMDILGREMLQIAHAADYSEGQHSIEVQTADLPTGIYLLTLRAGDDVMVKRIIKGN